MRLTHTSQLGIACSSKAEWRRMFEDEEMMDRIFKNDRWVSVSKTIIQNTRSFYLTHKSTVPLWPPRLRLAGRTCLLHVIQNRFSDLRHKQ